ncbi:MAG: hypothetical protein WBQ18_18505 [Solirubrobacteraceae bacterium]
MALLTALLAAVIMAPAAGAHPTFRPRAGHAMGILPRYDVPEIATGANLPVVFHGGTVMRNVTVHTVFWAPPGYQFDGAPSAGTVGYRALIEQFLSDVAHDSGSTSNAFSVLGQYGDHAGVGGYQIHYDPAVDSVTDTTPYPSTGRQCPSSAGVATCVTDLAIEHELDRLIGPANGAARGLSNLWFVFLPPDVDTCTQPGTCATSAYAGYHSLFQLGHGVTVYAPIPDPLVELTPPPGSDPQGNPEAELSLDTVAHEAVEAITDPLGTAWMDPNGFETGDKCETGPQDGTPLGYAPDGSPYNQLINGHQYLLQDMWSNPRNGCVQSSTAVASTPALHTLDLHQFSPAVSGSLGVARRAPVTVLLGRAGLPVAIAHGTTRANGTWGPFVLRGAGGRPHAVGDDRDQIEVVYGLGAGSPQPDFIATGSGGNPFTQSGYTGWLALDSGFAVHAGPHGGEVLIGPCSQTGVLTLRVGASPTQSPTDLCQTETDAAAIPTRHLGSGTALNLTSLDNRGAFVLNPNGTLVSMTVPLGEPDSVSALAAASRVPFVPTGQPSCTAFLRIQTMRCSGLVPEDRYTLVRHGRRVGHGRADGGGVVAIAGLAMRGGDVIGLVNTAGRRLTSLHVARLRVHLIGSQTTVASGTCEPGDYWGRPVTRPPSSAAVGQGIGGSGIT